MIELSYEYGGMVYSPKSLKLISDLTDRFRRDLLQETLDRVKRDSREFITEEDVWESARNLTGRDQS